MSTTTELSFAQHNRLDKIEVIDPDARIVDWDQRALGPLVAFSDGRKRAISPHGRLVPRAIARKAA